MIEHKNIHEAIIGIMQEVGYVQKQKGENLSYKYASERALIAALRPVMVDHGVYAHILSIVPSREQYTTSKGTMMTSTFDMGTVRFTHAPSATYIDAFATGEGADSGDKSGNKAATGLLKYALRQTFLIETGDDPDSTPSSEQEHAHKPAPAPQRVQMTTEDGMPVINEEGEPVMTTLPAGTFKFPVAEVYHAKSKDGSKDLLKVVLDGNWEHGNGKYGLTCFHAPEALKGYKDWEVDKRYTKVPPACAFVIVRAPSGGSKFPEVLEFQPA